MRKLSLLLVLILVSCVAQPPELPQPFAGDAIFEANDVWYLDNAASGANNGTSWANAWESFADIVWGTGGVDPGDTLYISGGASSKTYSGAQFTVGASGTASFRITISVSTDSGHDGTVIFDRGGGADAIEADSRSYVTLYGGAQKWQVTGFTDHGFVSDGTKTNLILDGLDFPLISEGAIRITYCTSCIVRNCKITTVTDSAGATDGIFSQHNTGNIYEHNWIGIYNANATPHCDGIQINQDTSTTVRFNYIEQVNSKTSNAQGIYATQSFGIITYYGNIVYNPNGNNALAYRNLTSLTPPGTAQFVAYNNTVKGGGNAILYLTEVANPILKNNIWWYTGTGISLKIYNWSGTASNIDYNLFYSPNDAETLYTSTWGSLTWAEWQSHGFDAHGINDSPDLDTDYSLLAGSPAINTAANLGGSYAEDYAGVTRPQGSAWDIGAYEYVSGEATSTPTATRTATATASRTPTRTNTPTATKTVTPTATLTPSATVTPTLTFTPSPTSVLGATATPTDYATRQACPTMAVTVDGAISEWGAVTPVAVNGTPGAYAYAIGTPVANGGRFWCAHDGTNLYIAGEITDGTIKDAVYDLYRGDAVELALDGFADGWNAPGWDDHALVIDTQDRVRDYVSRPISVTVSSGAASPGWKFEVMIPAELWRDPDAKTSSGQQLGAVYSVINRDDTGATWDDLRVSHLYALRLQ